MTSVRGEILIPGADVPPEAAEVVVQVEDVSRADAPSVVVGEKRLGRVRLEASQAVPFEVEVPADRVDPSASYSLRVHVDTSGSGQVEPGDLLTTQSHPVLTRGYGNQASVEVQRI
jgi:putative lipoprotein